MTGAGSETEAAKIARSVASSSLVKAWYVEHIFGASLYHFYSLIHGKKCYQAAVYGRDPNWGRIAAAAGYAGISFHPNKLRILLGDILLMDGGQPLPFER